MVFIDWFCCNDVLERYFLPTNGIVRMKFGGLKFAVLIVLPAVKILFPPVCARFSRIMIDENSEHYYFSVELNSIKIHNNIPNTIVLHLRLNLLILLPLLV